MFLFKLLFSFYSKLCYLLNWYFLLYFIVQQGDAPVSQISLKILAESSMLDILLSSGSTVGPLKSITLNFSSSPNLGSVNCKETTC